MDFIVLLGLSALLAAQIILWLEFYRKIFPHILLSPLNGYLLIGVGSYAFIIGESFGILTDYVQIFGVILGIIGVQLIFSRNWIETFGSVSIRTIWRISNYLSGIMIGVLLTSLSNSDTKSIQKTASIGFDGWLIVIPLLWFLSIIYLFLNTHDVSTFFGGNFHLLTLAKYTAFAGMICILFSTLVDLLGYAKIVGNPLNIGTGLIFLAITTYFHLATKDPENVFNIRSQYKFLVKRGGFSYALFKYDVIGPKLEFYNGFDFLQNDKEEQLLRLGITGMVLLGRGDEYIEGSVIIPLDLEIGFSCLGVSFWANDSTQEDERFEKQSFHLLLLAVNRSFEEIFEKRQRWETIIHGFIKSTMSNSGELTEDQITTIIEKAFRQVLFERHGFIENVLNYE